MNQSEYLDFHSQFCDKMKEITRLKNSDYCGDTDNPFANLELVEKIGACSTEVGVVTRISDKLSRLLSFLKTGFLVVKDEKIEDTLLDMANYIVLLAAVISKKRKKDLTSTFKSVNLKKASEGKNDTL